MTGAQRAHKRVATFAMDGEIHFATAADRAAFAEELARSVEVLTAKYHDETTPGGRAHRVVIALHPSVNTASKDKES